MALNIYDDTFDQLDPQPAITPRPAPAEARSLITNPGQERLLAVGQEQATKTPPEQASRILALEKRTGLPTEVITRNLDELEQKAKAADFDPETFRKTSPLLASWLNEHPLHSSVADDDLENLGFLEWLTTAPARAFASGVNSQKYSDLEFESWFRTLTPAEGDRRDAERYQAYAGGDLGAGSSWFRGAITAAGRLFGQQLPAVQEAAVYSAAFGLLGAATLGPAGAALGLKTGAAIGGIKGALFSNGVSEAVQAHDDLKTATDEFGKPIDGRIAKVAAIGVGALNGLIEVAELETMLASGGLSLFASQAKGAAGRLAMKTALKNPTVRAALLDLATNYAGTLTKETLQEVAQQAITITGEELAKSLSGGPTAERRTANEAGDELWQTLTGAVQSFALGLLPGPMMSVTRNIVRAQEAERNVAFYKALGEGMKASKVAERLPEAAQAFLEKTTKNGPVETVYAPLDTWDTYWQGQGIDPAEMAATVTGSPDAYQHARASGDLAIPTARYAVTLAGGEHNAYFANELRLDPDGMNARESADFKAMVKGMAVPGDKEAAPAAEADDPVLARILQTLTEAGVPSETALTMRQAYAAVTNLATRAGLPRESLFGPRTMTVARPDLATPAAAAPVAPAEAVAPAGPGAPPEPLASPAAAPVAPLGVPGAIDDDTGIRPNVGWTAARARERDAWRNVAITRFNSPGGLRTITSDGQTQHVVSIRLSDDPAAGSNILVTAFNAEGRQIHETAFATIAEAADALQGETLVDTRPAAGDTIEGSDATDQYGAGAGTGEAGVNAGRGVPASRAGTRTVVSASGASRVVAETVAQRTAREQLHYATVLADLLDSARALDPPLDIDLADFRAEFYFRLAAWHDLHEEYGDSGHEPTEILRAVAGFGGIAETQFEGMGGEIGDLKSGTRFGALGGVNGVFRKTTKKDARGQPISGLPLDVIVQRLQAEPKFEWIQDVNHLLDLLDDASRHPPAERDIFPGTAELASGVNIDATQAWWLDRMRPADEAENLLDADSFVDDAREAEGEGDVRFTTFDQGLFEEPPAQAEATKPTVKLRPGAQLVINGKTWEIIGRGESGTRAVHDGYVALKEPGTQDFGGETMTASPKELGRLYARGELTVADILDTGEVQPRLPGDVGAVQDQNVATPTFEAPFSLIPQIAKRKGAQRTLSQSRTSEAEWSGGDRRFIISPETGRATFSEEDSEATHAEMFDDAGMPGSFDDYLRGVVNAEQNEIVILHTDEQLWPKAQMSDKVWNVLEMFITVGANKNTRVSGFPGIMGEITLGKQFPFLFAKGAHRTLFQGGPVTNEAVHAFAASIKAKVGAELQELDLHLTQTGDIRLDVLVVRRHAQRTGIGSSVVAAVVGYADQHGLRVTLLPASRNTAFGTTSRSRLVRFYRRFGFIENTGRSKDFSLPPDSMVREPTLNARTLYQPLYHGGGHDLTRFSTDFVGTGQGAATYGWGLYFAESAEVAGSYRQMLTERGPIVSLTLGSFRLGRDLDYTRLAHVSDLENIRASLIEDLLIRESELRANDPQEFALSTLDDQIADYVQNWPEGVAAAKELRAEIARPGAVKLVVESETGGIYKVDVSDTHIATMLDWDARLEAQPAAVLDALDAAGVLDVKALRASQEASRALDELASRPAAWHAAHPEGTAQHDALRADRLDAEQRISDSLWRLVNGVVIPEGAQQSAGYGDYPLKIRTGEDLYRALTQREAAIINRDVIEQHSDVLSTYTALYNLGTASEAQLQRLLETISSLNLRIELNRDTAKKMASLYLATIGIPGLRYFDQGSRAKQEGTRNVVVFDDRIVTLTHKNGKPVTAQERAEFFQTDMDALESYSRLRQSFTSPQALFQAEPRRRGAIRFGPEREFVISLLERADLSTFLHETGHFFLELYGDVVDQLSALDPATLDASQQGVLADYAAILKHLGVATRGELTDQHHEVFADTFLAYLREGQAPSMGLRSAFATFRSWLLGLGKALLGVKVNLTPEVRGFFDRLMASDEAIAEAEAQRDLPAMFTTAEAMGVTPEQFALYVKAGEAAHQKAVERLDATLAADAQREQTRAWKAQRAEIEKEVSDEKHQEPIYRALAAIRYGTHPNGDPFVEGIVTPPMRLSRQIIVAKFGGEPRLARLPRPSVYTSDREGLHPTFVSELFGFSSGDALLNAIEAAVPLHQAIANETTRRMLAEHGGLLFDGTLFAKAREAISNESRDAIIRAELRALRQLQRTVKPFVAQERQSNLTELQAEKDAHRKDVSELKRQARGGAVTIREGIPSADVIRDAAKERIAAMQIAQVRPATFWSASRRAGVQARERAARQDFAGAITAATQELVNLALYREAERVLADVADRTRFARHLAHPATRARLGLAGGSYLDQIDAILDRFGFAPASQKTLARVGKLKDFLEKAAAEGMPTDDIPADVLSEASRRHYSDMTVEEFIGVTDGLRMLAHLAGLKLRLLKQADRRAFVEVRDSLVTSIREKNTAHKRRLEFRPKDNAARLASYAFAAHKKLSTIFEALDGGVFGGPMWETLMRPINAASDAKQARNVLEGEAFNAIVSAHYPGREFAKLNDMVEIPAIRDSLSREGRLMIALYSGSVEGRERLQNDPSRQWTQAQVDAILDTLDERDWRFVSATWTYLNTFWPEIAAQQKRLTGLEPERVEPAPVKTKFGEVPGGYAPLAYDRRLSARAGRNEAATEAKIATSAAYLRLTTKRGFVETRMASVTLPVRLDLGVVFGHIDQVIQSLTHQEMLIDVTRLLRDSQVSQAILDTAGDQIYDQIVNTVSDIATGGAPIARNMMDKAANFMRPGVQIAGLGWNAWTALQQPLGIFNGMGEVGSKWVMRGAVRWMRDAAHMEATSQWIYSVSPMMKQHALTATLDLRELRERFSHPGGWFDNLLRTLSQDHLTKQAILDSFLYFIKVGQHVADVPTWLGAYEKHMAGGETEARAIALADQAVLNAQGGGHVKDLAAVERGGPVARLYMTFYSYGSTLLNSNIRAVGRTNFRSPSSVGRFLGSLTLINIVPAALIFAMKVGLGKADAGDDDEWVTTWLDGVGREALSSALNGVVFVRELTGLLAEEVRGYAGPAGARGIQAAYQLGRQVQQGELDEALLRAINQTAGVFLKYPAGQVQRTIDGWTALTEGRSTNPLVLVVGPPPKRKAN